MSITHTRGDSFEVRVTMRLNGEPMDLTGWGIRAQMRDPQKVLVHDFAPVTAVNLEGGQFVLEADYATTKNWAPGAYDCDIEVTAPDDSWRKSTPPFRIAVSRDITRTEP